MFYRIRSKALEEKRKAMNFIMIPSIRDLRQRNLIESIARKWRKSYEAAAEADQPLESFCSKVFGGNREKIGSGKKSGESIQKINCWQQFSSVLKLFGLVLR